MAMIARAGHTLCMFLRAASLFRLLNTLLAPTNTATSSSSKAMFIALIAASIPQHRVVWIQLPSGCCPEGGRVGTGRIDVDVCVQTYTYTVHYFRVAFSIQSSNFQLNTYFQSGSRSHQY